MPSHTDTTWIQTYTGRKFHPLDPLGDDVCVEDIAHSLSRQSRFTGHTKGPLYTIAEHSVRVCDLIREQPVAPKRAGGNYLIPFETEPERLHASRWGLFHDAGEAYLVDLPSPIKRDPRFAFFVETENKILRAIAAHFKLPAEMPPIVKWADAVLFRTESEDLMAPLHPEFRLPDVKRLETRIEPWEPALAEARFMERYRELFQTVAA